MKFLKLIIIACFCCNISLLRADETSFKDWPKEILIDAGDLQVRLESRSFWTLYRVEHKGVRIGIDLYGSHYGTVVNYPKNKFIGSGHVENEKEQIISLKLLVDGREEKNPLPKYSCSSFELIKQYKIRQLTFDSSISVKNGKIIESVAVSAEKAETVSFIYFFMHPWETAFSDFAALDKENEMTGKFTDSKKYMINRPARITALFSEKLNKGLVTIINQVPENVKWLNRYWDVPKRYRKHYLMAFMNTTISPGTQYSFQSTTIPFDATPENWLQKASEIAAPCKGLP